MDENTLKSCDSLHFETVKKYLKTSYIGANYKYYDVICSTNKEVKRLLKSGTTIENGAVFIAETQTNGSGKLNRTWHSPEKCGLWFTLVLNTHDKAIDISKITLLAGAAICSALRSKHIDSSIKWPNDIYINDKKIGGILTECIYTGDKCSSLIIGVGLNINSTKDSFPEELRDYASSIFIETEKKFNRAEILGSVLNSFENFIDDLKNSGNYDKVLEVNRKYSNILGRNIRIVSPNGLTYDAYALAISDNGSLIIEDNNGHKKEVISGEVSIRI